LATPRKLANGTDKFMPVREGRGGGQAAGCKCLLSNDKWSERNFREKVCEEEERGRGVVEVMN